MRSNEEIIELMNQLKDEKNISISELARRVGMAKSAISRYFNFQTVADLRKGKAKLSRLSLGNALKLMAIIPFYDKCLELELVEDGYWWQDANGNRWFAPRYSREQAAAKALTMVNCFNCVNCHDCKDCTGCDESYSLENCKDCSLCGDCINCTDCSDCRHCKDADHLMNKIKNIYSTED